MIFFFVSGCQYRSLNSSPVPIAQQKQSSVLLLKVNMTSIHIQRFCTCFLIGFLRDQGLYRYKQCFLLSARSVQTQKTGTVSLVWGLFFLFFFIIVFSNSDLLQMEICEQRNLSNQLILTYEVQIVIFQDAIFFYYYITAEMSMQIAIPIQKMYIERK